MLLGMRARRTWKHGARGACGRYASYGKVAAKKAASITRSLAQEFGVQIVDKHLPDSRFGEAVLPVHGDELAADALELGKCYECGG